VKLGAGIAETLLAGAEGAEVLGGLGDDVFVKVEVDVTLAAGVFDCEVNRDGHFDGVGVDVVCCVFGLMNS